jgi:ketosteroid isomerase-like protein|tara:strand:+ start:4723 stop:5046 length:324 start_codon:yes stop_codon:yes gene_type:complete
MSILEKYQKAFIEKDLTAWDGLLHDDYKFTLHASGKVLSKQDVIGWAKSGDIVNREKVRIVYENDEIGVEHAFVTFKDGKTQAVMMIMKYQDGKIISAETGATDIPK